MGVRIVGLPDKYDGGFHPFIEGFGTYVLPVRNDIEIFFPDKEIGRLLMNIAAAIETGVDDDSLLPDIPSQGFFKYGTHALIIHGANMDIPDLTLREGVGLFAPEIHPSFVKQFALLPQRNGFGRFFPAGRSNGVI